MHTELLPPWFLVWPLSLKCFCAFQFGAKDLLANDNYNLLVLKLQSTGVSPIQISGMLVLQH